VHQNESVVFALPFFKIYIFQKHAKKVQQWKKRCVGIHKSANIFEASANMKADEKKNKNN
jgi:hypothetical protein